MLNTKNKILKNKKQNKKGDENVKKAMKTLNFVTFAFRFHVERTKSEH